ncbi:MAG: YkvA family protein [Pelolinea sp.]|nr:YkvA family protein [Pelolinea sp.]
MIIWFRKIIEKRKINSSKLKTEIYSLYLAFKHPSTPWYAKVFSGIVVAYAFSPIDLIPDFIPVLGYLDDLILVPLGIAVAIKMIPTEVMAECRAKAEANLSVDKPTNWIAALVIILIWVGLAALCVRALFKLVPEWWSSKRV